MAYASDTTWTSTTGALVARRSSGDGDWVWVPVVGAGVRIVVHALRLAEAASIDGTDGPSAAVADCEDAPPLGLSNGMCSTRL
jgi:hypothetical protein